MQLHLVIAIGDGEVVSKICTARRVVALGLIECVVQRARDGVRRGRDTALKVSGPSVPGEILEPGAAGIDAERGATCAHFHEAEVKQKVLSLARESYLVVDSSKIGKLQRAFFAPMSAFKAIITEHGETPAVDA